MPRRMRSIEVGERYLEQGEGPFGQTRRRIWEVGRTYEGSDGIVYAQVVHPDTKTVKTLSQSALQDPHFFRPVE